MLVANCSINYDGLVIDDGIFSYFFESNIGAIFMLIITFWVPL